MNLFLKNVSTGRLFNETISYSYFTAVRLKLLKTALSAFGCSNVGWHHPLDKSLSS